VSVCNKNTELFTTTDADTLFESLIEAATISGIKCKVSGTTYKVKMTKDIEDGSELKITASILSAGDKNCLEFIKNEGNKVHFF